MILWTLPLATVMLVFSGCSDYEEEVNDELLKSIVIDAPQAPANADAAYQIAESAKSVAESLTKLAKIQRAQHPEYYKKSPEVVKKDVPGQITINYIGPIEPLLKKLAQATKSSFKRLGSPTGTPIIVSLNVQNGSIKDAIEDIAYQAANHAVVELTSKGVIQLKYLKV